MPKEENYQENNYNELNILLCVNMPPNAVYADGVNLDLHKLILGLRKLDRSSYDKRIRIKIVQFGSKIKKYPLEGSIYARDYLWKDLQPDYGNNIGLLFRGLNEKVFNSTALQDKRYHCEEDVALKPLICFVIAQKPSDDFNNRLNELLDNNKFEQARKVFIYYNNEVISKRILGEEPFIFENEKEFLLALKMDFRMGIYSGGTDDLLINIPDYESYIELPGESYDSSISPDYCDYDDWN